LVDTGSIKIIEVSYYEECETPPSTRD